MFWCITSAGCVGAITSSFVLDDEGGVGQGAEQLSGNKLKELMAATACTNTHALKKAKLEGGGGDLLAANLGAFEGASLIRTWTTCPLIIFDAAARREIHKSTRDRREIISPDKYKKTEGKFTKMHQEAACGGCGGCDT